MPIWNISKNKPYKHSLEKNWSSGSVNIYTFCLKSNSNSNSAWRATSLMANGALVKPWGLVFPWRIKTDYDNNTVVGSFNPQPLGWTNQRLVESWSRYQGECSDSLDMWTFHLYDSSFHNILKFNKKKYTVSSQLNYHVVEYFDLQTIEK